MLRLLLPTILICFGSKEFRSEVEAIEITPWNAHIPDDEIGVSYNRAKKRKGKSEANDVQKAGAIGPKLKIE